MDDYDPEYKNALERKDVWKLCEYCEDGDEKEMMDEVKLIHYESLDHIYQSEEAFIHHAIYECPECKLRLDYLYDNGTITKEYDTEDWKFYEYVYEYEDWDKMEITIP